MTKKYKMNEFDRRVRFAGHGYENRRDFADVWAKLETDEEE